jgi:hypothetical protein
MKYTWTCKCCGQIFDTLPMSYGFSAPRNWFGLPEAERDTRAELGDDICIIDRSERYVRGCVEIPVFGSSEGMIWGVWVSVSEESLRYILARWNSPIAPDEPPRFGWLSTWIKGYPEPNEIQCDIFLRSDSLRPRIVLRPSEYPLAVEQHRGITLGRVEEIAAGAGHL